MRHLLRFALLAALAATPFAARAQYVPSLPARPFPGYINEHLRASDPYMNAWDIGVNIRERFEDKDDAGFNYTGSNADFRLSPLLGTGAVPSPRAPEAGHRRHRV